MTCLQNTVDDIWLESIHLFALPHRSGSEQSRNSHKHLPRPVDRESADCHKRKCSYMCMGNVAERRELMVVRGKGSQSQWWAECWEWDYSNGKPPHNWWWNDQQRSEIHRDKFWSQAKFLTTMMEVLLNDIPVKSLHQVQNSIWSVVYNVVEQVMFALLRKDCLLAILDTQIAQFFGTDPVADRLSKGLRPKAHSWPLLQHLRCTTDTVIEQQRSSNALTKNVPINTVETCSGVDDSAPSRSDSRSDQLPRRGLLTRRSKTRLSYRERNYCQRHSS